MDFKFRNSITPNRGKILISDPFNNGNIFERSVVFLCNHDDEGSFGFIINKPIRISMKGLEDQLPETIVTAYQGGPVETDSLFYLHTLGDEIKESQPLGKGVYLGYNYKELYKKMTPELIEEGAIKLFIGYCGWASRQLDEELEKNFWAVLEIEDINDIILPREDMWQYFMQKLGKKYEIMSNFPINPNDN